MMEVLGNGDTFMPPSSPATPRTATYHSGPSTPKLRFADWPSDVPPSSPGGDSESSFALVEEDITTMELETPVDAAPRARTFSVSEPPAHQSNESADIKDLDYYMDIVVFKVEGSLYRVPTHYFKASTDFFTPHFESLVAKEGHGDQNVFKLEDVTNAEFRALLKLMYPLPLALMRTLMDEEWIAVLKLSTKWMMLDIRRMAIEHLTSATMSPVDRVILARSCSVVEWLRSAYVALANTAADIPSEDAAKIGLESTFKLHRAREQVLSAIASPALNPDHRSAIQTAFDGELQQMQDYSQNAINRVLLAKEYDVAEWLRSAFVELVARPQSLSVDEAKTLGIETAIGLCGARELHILQGSPTQNRDTLVNQELGMELHSLTSHCAPDRVVLARKYEVSVWLHAALVELVERGEKVSMEEATTLGLETAIELCCVRQECSFLVATHSIQSYEGAINGEFEGELRNVRVAGEHYSLPEKVDKVATPQTEGLAEAEKPDVVLADIEAVPAEPEEKKENVPKKGIARKNLKKKKKPAY